MKSLFTFLSLILFSITAHSQILNGGFEDWTNGKPNDWTNIDTSVYIHTDTAFHSGSSSFFSSVYCEFPPTNCHDLKFSNSTKAHPRGSAVPKGASSLVFWYKLLAGGGASAAVFNSLSGAFTTIYDKPDSMHDPNSWRKFSIPLYKPVDSVEVEFTIRVSDISHAGIAWGSLYLDDISFEMPNAVNSSEPSSNIISVSPNPISDHANLHYQSDGVEPIQVTLFDVMGREVLRLPQVESVSGEGMIPFDCKQLPNGLYYLRFEKGSVVVSRKFIVAH